MCHCLAAGEVNPRVPHDKNAGIFDGLAGIVEHMARDLAAAFQGDHQSVDLRRTGFGRLAEDWLEDITAGDNPRPVARGPVQRKAELSRPIGR